MSRSEMQEEMLDLMTSEAIYGLSAGERAELDRLTREFPGLRDESLALAAAAVQMSGLDTSDDLPEHVRTSVQSEYDRLFGATESSTVQGTDRSREEGWLNIRWMGWAFGAVASALLVFQVFIGDRAPREGPVAVQRRPSEASMPAQRAALLASAPDLLTVQWAVDEKKPSGVTGDVVWSQSQQRGFMRFQGLAVNDKSRETYQLWIFDENQSDATPVDGGVFDVESSGEIVIPIDAKIRVGKALAFAVTVEKPGGVVVSKREKVAALAKVGA